MSLQGIAGVALLVAGALTGAALADEPNARTQAEPLAPLAASAPATPPPFSAPAASASPAAPAPPSPPPVPAPTRRSGSIGVGLTGLSGTTESLALTSRLKLALESPRWAWDFDGDASLMRIERGEGAAADPETEDHEIDTTLRLTLGPRSFLSAKGGWDREPQNGVLAQATLGAGLGLHLARGERFSARIEAGIGGAEVERVDEDRRYPEAYATSHLEIGFGNGAKLSWSADLKFGSGDGSDFVSDQELDLESPLTHRLALAVLLDWEYDSDPAAGFDTDDLKLLARLSWKLWAKEP